MIVRKLKSQPPPTKTQLITVGWCATGAGSTEKGRLFSLGPELVTANMTRSRVSPSIDFVARCRRVAI